MSEDPRGEHRRARHDTAPGREHLRASVHRDLERLNHPPADWVVPRSAPDGRRAHDVLIVGAGMCALAALHALRCNGIQHIQALDRRPAGREGPWATYARMLTLRSPKDLPGPCFGLPGLSFRAWYEARWGAGAWDSLDKIPTRMWMDYLVWYRDVLDLPVRNTVDVTRIGPTEDGLLRVEAGDKRMYARHVVLAQGREGVGGPRYPAFCRDLPAERLSHSLDEVDFAALAGRRVAIVGGSSSACDNAGAALEAGAAEVVMLVRAADFARVNKTKGAGYPGFVQAFAAADDAWRWQVWHYIHRTARVPPPQASVLRLTRHPRFRLRFDAGVEAAGFDGREVVLETASGPERTDHVILGTGYTVDLTRIGLLGAAACDVATWGDRYRPPAGLEDEELARAPYLGPAFELQAKSPDGPDWLSRVHVFSHAASQSHWTVAGDIPAVDLGATRLADGIARLLFEADRAAHWQRLLDFDDPELEGWEWADARTGASDRD